MSFNADVWHYMVSVIQINVGAFEYVLDMAAAARVFVPVIRQLFFPAHVHFPPISGENPGERILDAGILIIEVPFFEQPVVRVVGRIGESRSFLSPKMNISIPMASPFRIKKYLERCAVVSIVRHGAKAAFSFRKTAVTVAPFSSGVLWFGCYSFLVVTM